MVSSATSSYESLNRYQKPITIPEFEKPQLSPEKQLELKDTIAQKIDDIKENVTEQKDANREFFTGALKLNSAKSQVEIYMSVSTDNDVDVGMSSDATVNVLKELRETQKQNNIVQAYATYKDATEDLFGAY